MSTTKKTAVPAIDTPSWNVVHLFGYGETQIIGAQHNGKVANEQLKNLDAFIAYLAGMQQKGTKIATSDLHSINILNGSFIDFSSRTEKNKSQRFAWADINAKQVNKFVDEVIKKATPPEANYMATLASLTPPARPEAAKKAAPAKATAKTVKKAPAKKAVAKKATAKTKK